MVAHHDPVKELLLIRLDALACRVPIGCRHCLIGSEPELGLEAEIGGGFFGTVSVGFGAGHGGEIRMRNQDFLRPRIE